MPMSPLQSWALIIVMFIGVIGLIVVILDVEGRIRQRALRREQERAPLPAPIPLRPKSTPESARPITRQHLRLVSGDARPIPEHPQTHRRRSHSAGASPFYDWAEDGL